MSRTVECKNLGFQAKDEAPFLSTGELLNIAILCAENSKSKEFSSILKTSAVKPTLSSVGGASFF